MAVEQDELVTRTTEVIKRLICEVADVDPGVLGDDVLLFPDLAADLGIDAEALHLTTVPGLSLDSLDMLDALVAFEESFGLHYDLNDLESHGASPEQLATPRRIAEYIVANLGPEQVASVLASEGGG
jgi:acyl carrier protein